MVNMGETVQNGDSTVGVYSNVGSPTRTLLDTGEEDQDLVLLLERRSFRPFKSSDDYLYAMKEDLAEWLNGLYDLNINVDNFFERLENGVVLCEHANNVKRSAEEHTQKNPGKKFSSRYEIPNYEIHFRRDSAAGSFFARDNIHNFIRWCRDLGVHDVLMFETDDLVLRKNEKHVILALLEIARRGARFGMAAPLLIQMEDDIDREIEKDRLALEGLQKGLRVGQEEEGVEWTVEGTTREDNEPPNLIYGPQPQVITNDLMSLDEMVRDLVGRCNCPTQFPMIKVSEGKYRIGDTKVLIFVRILRNHVMVRVGGGWDTLHHYLDKHDPCRCRAGHRSTISAKVGFKHPTVGERDLRSVTYERSEEGYTSSPMARRRSNGLRRESNDGRSSVRHRSQSPALRDFANSVNSPKLGGRVTASSKEDQSPAAGDQWCDSSSEVSDEGYKSQGPPRSTLRTRRISPKKPNAADLPERPDSSMTQLSSEGSSVSAEDIGLPPSPPHSPPSGGTPSNPWNSVPKQSHSSRSSASSRNKSPFLDDLLTKKTKSKSLSDGKRTWNAGPGMKPGDEPRSRRSSVSSDAGDGRKITRSRSATSEGGFQNMLKKESGGRQSLRSGASRLPPVDASAGKNTWNGRIRQRDYPTLYADTFRPPPVARSIRSSSASPATTRKIYTSSAPATPLNRSPKRSNPAGIAPPLPPSILSKLPEMNTDADGDAEILLQLEGFVNNYRAYVLDKLAAEGRAVPPELAEEDLETENERPSATKDPKFTPIKANPRKSGIGSRIPAPVF